MALDGRIRACETRLLILGGSEEIMSMHEHVQLFRDPGVSGSEEIMSMHEHVVLFRDPGVSKCNQPI